MPMTEAYRPFLSDPHRIEDDPDRHKEPELPSPHKTLKHGGGSSSSASSSENENAISRYIGTGTDGYFKLYRTSSFSSDLENEYEEVDEPDVESWVGRLVLDEVAQEKWNLLSYADKKRLVGHGTLKGDNHSANLVARINQLNKKKVAKHRSRLLPHRIGINGRTVAAHLGPYSREKSGGHGINRWNLPIGYKAGTAGGAWSWGSEGDWPGDELPILKLKNIPFHINGDQIADWFGTHSRNITGKITIDRSAGLALVEFRNLGFAYAAKSAKEAAPLRGHLVDIIGPLKQQPDSAASAGGEIKEFMAELKARENSGDLGVEDIMQKYEEWKLEKRRARSQPAIFFAGANDLALASMFGMQTGERPAWRRSENKGGDNAATNWTKPDGKASGVGVVEPPPAGVNVRPLGSGSSSGLSSASAGARNGWRGPWDKRDEMMEGKGKSHMKGGYFNSYHEESSNDADWFGKYGGDRGKFGGKSTLGSILSNLQGKGGTNYHMPDALAALKGSASGKFNKSFYEGGSARRGLDQMMGGSRVNAPPKRAGGPPNDVASSLAAALVSAQGEQWHGQEGSSSSSRDDGGLNELLGSLMGPASSASAPAAKADPWAELFQSSSASNDYHNSNEAHSRVGGAKSNGNGGDFLGWFNDGSNKNDSWNNWDMGAGNGSSSTNNSATDDLLKNIIGGFS
ncbi:unnamed protein product [Amoebophrya sp. A25]|nr:unnamed protein product [Amoebophrya sp. A25]|eukprot:GSA25T00001810001.1